MRKNGDYAHDNRIYECSSCGNLKAVLEGEKLGQCTNCYKPQHWKPTKKEFILRSRNVAKDMERKKTFGDRLADVITDFCGSMPFVVIHVIWFSWWVWHNTTNINSFDPFPFGLLTLVVSLEAIFLATFILISQNRQGQISELRSELDYQVDSMSAVFSKHFFIFGFDSF